SEAPRGTAVPPRVRRVLLRGLAYDPQARYPSITALLTELTRDPSRRRRRGLWAPLAMGAPAPGGYGEHPAVAARQAKLCTGADAEAAQVWNSAVQGDIERSLLATGVPYAGDTWQRTRDHIDAYMADWRKMYAETCEATRLRGEQSE